MRIDGVEQVKGSKYIMLHAPRSALPAIAKLLPGSEAPDRHSRSRPRRPRGGARGVPRKRVLGNLSKSSRARATSVLVLPVEKMLHEGKFLVLGGRLGWAFPGPRESIALRSPCARKARVAIHGTTRDACVAPWRLREKRPVFHAPECPPNPPL